MAETPKPIGTSPAGATPSAVTVDPNTAKIAELEAKLIAQAKKHADELVETKVNADKHKEKAVLDAHAGFGRGDLINQIKNTESENQKLREQLAVLQKNQKALASTGLGDSELLDAKPKASNEMAIADCRVHLDKLHDVPKVGVTPAEVVLLVAQFHQAKGDIPVHALVPHVERKLKLDANKKIVRNEETFEALYDNVETRFVVRAAHQEVGRLKSKFGAKKVEAIFPGVNPTLPTTFREALQMGVSTVLPNATLSKEQGGESLGAIVINA
jgi:hypothetical protein